jgi:hypothetical protein
MGLGSRGERNNVGENPRPGSMAGEQIKFITAMWLWVRLGELELDFQMKGRASRGENVQVEATDLESAGVLVSLAHVQNVRGCRHKTLSSKQLDFLN